jgi:NAD+ synthase
MTRIDSYEDLTDNIVDWLKDYYYENNVKAFVVGVSGGIDSAVVSSLCARTGLPTYVVCMPLESKFENSRLSDVHSKALVEKHENVKRIEIELFSAYDSLLKSIEWWSETQFFDKKEFTSSEHANANTKSRMCMITLYQIAGSVGGIVVGTGNKVEDYGVGFYTKYGDGGVDIAPIADIYKTEVWDLGRHLGVNEKIIEASPTDGLWDDKRTDEDQLGASYAQLEEAMEYGTGPAVKILETFNGRNKHKMESIPTFKL